jgi:hypothetical protein
MTNWKSLQDNNPEPSLLDAIAHAEKNKAIDDRINAMLAEHGIVTGDDKPVRLKTAILDGKTIAFSSETTFLVQVGRYAKGAYRTRYSFTGNLAQACHYYRCINIGRGYKKRLVMVGANKPVLARAAS